MLSHTHSLTHSLTHPLNVLSCPFLSALPPFSTQRCMPVQWALDLHSPPNNPVCLFWVARQAQWKDIRNGHDLGFFTIVFDGTIVRTFVICCPGYAPPVFADSLYYMLVATPKGLLQLSDSPTCCVCICVRMHGYRPRSKRRDGVW